MQTAWKTLLQYLGIPIPAGAVVAAVAIIWWIFREKRNLDKQKMDSQVSGMEERLKTMEERLKEKDGQLDTKQCLIDFLRTQLQHNTPTTYAEKDTDEQQEPRIFLE